MKFKHTWTGVFLFIRFIHFDILFRKISIVIQQLSIFEYFGGVKLWNVEICKIHWKLMIFKSQYCFANISATKALICIKIEIYINKIVKNHQRKRKHGRARFVVTKWTCTRLRLVCAHVCTDLSKICWWFFLSYG